MMQSQLTPSDQLVITELRKKGFAIVIYHPFEVENFSKDISASELEDIIIDATAARF